ncbi:3'-5' exonuclease [Nocardia sp. NPDC003482]
MTASVDVPAALHGQQLAVVDVEGNGHNPPEIIEIAVLPITDLTDPANMRAWLIRPQNPISSIVTRKVHGITNSDVADSPTWEQVAPEIRSALEGRILVAHNAKVESSVIGRHLPGWAPPLVLDTLRLAKKVWPGLSGYSLDKLIESAKLDITAIQTQGYHRAAYDAWAAWQLLARLTTDSGFAWPDLVAAAATPDYAPAPEPEGGLW